ncbi:MAG: primase-helicase family protein [Xanthobacteraceae bacterium]
MSAQTAEQKAERDTFRTALKELLETRDKKDTVAILEKYGASNGTTLAPEYFADVLAQVKALPMAGEAGEVSGAIETETEAEADEKLKKRKTLIGFVCYMPDGSFYKISTGKRYEKPAMINIMCGPGAARAIAKYSPVHELTWIPGQPRVIRDKEWDRDELIDSPENNLFNTYRAPTYEPGDPNDIAPWLDLVKRLYPNEWRHIVMWLAYKTQHPADKVNHALVLGGAPDIGKDTLLAPLRVAVGKKNFDGVSASQAADEKFNPHLENVVLRIDEARDFGEKNRYSFYEMTKPWLASPPETLTVADKNVKAHPILNCVGVVITTNHKAGGMYLPANDRRHFVAWSDVPSPAGPMSRAASRLKFRKLYAWYAGGGARNVATYLATMDLSRFDPKAPPPKTAAFYEIVRANTAPDQDDVATIVVDVLGRPDALTIEQVISVADSGSTALDWSTTSGKRQAPRQLEAAGYVHAHNPAREDGRWKKDGKAVTIYASNRLTPRQRIAAAERLASGKLEPWD